MQSQIVRSIYVLITSLTMPALAANQLSWTRERQVQVRDGRLTIRMFLKDDHTYAALSEVLFHFMDHRTSP
jgi:hypothetical protein